MTEREVYGPAPWVDEAIEAIARRHGAHPDLVGSCFSGVNVYDDRVHLRLVRESTEGMNEAARHAANLVKAFSRLSSHEREHLVNVGAPTVVQIRYLASVLHGHAKSLEEWRRQPNQKGGRNPAAYQVAEATRRLFRRLRCPITFGQTPEGGPSTEFGCAVAHAIGAFRVSADWRRPAEAAFKRQKEIQYRLQRLHDLRPKPVLLPMPEEVEVDFEGRQPEREMVLRVRGRSDIPAHRVCTCRFKSGREMGDYAARWLQRLNTNPD